jgi:hypothetical protein
MQLSLSLVLCALLAVSCNGLALAPAIRSLYHVPDMFKWPSSWIRGPWIPQEWINDCDRQLTQDIWKLGRYDRVLWSYLTLGPPEGEAQWLKKPDKSAMEVVRSWASRIPDFTCLMAQSDLVCDGRDITGTGRCEAAGGSQTGPNDPRAATILKAISNYAIYSHSLAAKIVEIGEEIKDSGGDLMKTFARESFSRVAPPNKHNRALVIASGDGGVISAGFGLPAAAGAIKTRELHAWSSEDSLVPESYHDNVTLTPRDGIEKRMIPLAAVGALIGVLNGIIGIAIGANSGAKTEVKYIPPCTLTIASTVN